MQAAGEELHRLLAAEDQLRQIGEEAASRAPALGKWSKKEILGHLIDSAANNHQCCVRLQLETDVVLPGYAQDGWVVVQDYQQRSWPVLVELWVAYNRHLAHIIQRMDSDDLSHVWHSPDGEVTLEFLVKDYLRHTRHHLRQILGLNA